MVNHVEEFIRTVPKAELHMHLEGSLEPEMLFRLAERNKIDLRWSSEEALLAAYEFANLEDFLTLYFEGCRVLVTERDFYDVTAAYLAKASEQGIRRAELFLGRRALPSAECRSKPSCTACLARSKMRGPAPPSAPRTS